MSALDIWFSLVAWLADKPRPHSSTFHSAVAETGNRRTNDRTLRSEARKYVTFPQFGICAHFVTEIHSLTSKKIHKATAAVTPSDKQATQWHFLHSTPPTVVHFQGHTVHVSSN
jgi:hypothetical protein